MRRISVPGIVALLSAAASTALAQTPDVATQAPSARAQRDADKVFQLIRVHSDKPRRWDKDAKEPAAGKAAGAASGAPRPVDAAAAATPAAPVAPGTPAPATVARGATPSLPSIAAPSPTALAAAGPAASTAAMAAPASAPGAPSVASTARSPGEGAPLVSDDPATPATPAPSAASADAGEADEEPLTLVNQVEPRFSAAAMQSLRKGLVQVRFEVRPDGSVGQPEVVRTTSARLNGAALAAVSQWRFQPLRKAQVGVVDLSFSLD